MQRVYFYTPKLDRQIRLAWANSRVKKTAAIDALLVETGWPRHAITGRARDLGITPRSRTWTAADDKRLLMELGSRSVTAIARDMGRSRSSVCQRASKLRLSVAAADRYTISDLKRIFGAPVREIESWVERGLFGRMEEGLVSDVALVTFIWRHMDVIDFRLVDQDFLKGVLRDGKRAKSTKQADAGAARRSQQARNQSRRAAGHVQGALAFPRADSADRERAPFMGQEDARFAATA